MAQYIVSIDHEESNPEANNLSISGRVNKIPCAVVIRLSKVKSLKPKEAKSVKQTALVTAFLNRQEALTESDGEMVEV